MNKFSFDKKFPGDKEIMGTLSQFTEKMSRMFYHLQEKAGLAMVNRKTTGEFDNDEIAGCAAALKSPYSHLEPRVSITMDENGYTITKIHPPGSIGRSFCFVTFSQLAEVEKQLPDYGYIKVDGKWQKA